MSNPLRQIKQQPWGVGLQIATLTVVLCTLVEMLLYAGEQVLPILTDLRMLFYSPKTPFYVLTFVIVGMGVGAMAMGLTEVLHPWLRLTPGPLWTVLACLLVALWLREQLPMVPSPLFTQISQPGLIGILLGASWKSWPQWRY